MNAPATPRSVTVEQIEDEISSEHFFTALDGLLSAGGSGKQKPAGDRPLADPSLALGLLTFCVLVLRNGFTVTGQSACADPAKFNAEMGRTLAREDAIRQCWKLLGFRLRDQLASEQATQPAAKRYTDADIADLRVWPIEGSPGSFGVLARMSDDRVFRTAVGTPGPSPIAAVSVLAVLKVANGETP